MKYLLGTPIWNDLADIKPTICRLSFYLLACELLCVLTLLSCKASPESAEQSDPGGAGAVESQEQRAHDRLIVHYADNAEIAVEDWEFRYTFGSQDTEPREFTWYPEQATTSRDLYLQKETTKRSITSKREVVFKGDQISKIRFEWAFPVPAVGKPASYESGSLYQIVIIPKKGSSQTYEAGDFDVSDTFLTKQRFVFEKELHLIGRVRQGNSFSDFDLRLWFGLSAQSKKEQVDEIRF